MALPNRHFKIRFNSEEIYSEAKGLSPVYSVLPGLFNFVKRGMKISDECFADSDGVVDTSAVVQLTNGSWTGVVGALNRSEVDYVPGELPMMEERWDAVAYNYPFAIDEIAFATRKPEYSPETMGLFRTLSPNVWSSLLSCTILVTLACFLAMKHRCSLGDILLHVFAIALNQEGNLVPRRAGEVMLLCTWTFAMAVFTFCFKSVLLSFLTFPPLGGVRTVPELAAAIRAGQYVGCNNYDETTARYIQTSPVDDFRVIGESMLKTKREVITCFLDGKHPFKAIVYPRSMIADIFGMVYVSKDNVGSLYFATAVSKRFCCKEEMDMLIHRFLAAGIDLKIERYRDYVTDFYLSPDAPDDQEEIRKITMADLAGAFIFLVAGHCLSLCVLIIECYVKRRKRRRSSTRPI